MSHLRRNFSSSGYEEEVARMNWLLAAVAGVSVLVCLTAFLVFTFSHPVTLVSSRCCCGSSGSRRDQ
jgi:hypothetical protein